MQFIFKIGALPATKNSAYFVYPGRERAETFFAPADQAALAAIRAAYSHEDLECEPQLAPAARELGLTEGAITPDRAAMIGLMTFEVALPGQFQEIKQTELVYQYGLACGEFWRAAPWCFDCAREILELVFRGDVREAVEAVIFGRTGEPSGLTMFPGSGSASRVDALYRQGLTDGGPNLSTLGVSFDADPAFAVDGMRRAFGLERFPVPVKLLSGDRVRLREDDLLALTIAQRAVANLTVAGAPGVAQLRIEKLAAEVVVTSRKIV
jgi:hypothetical protein